MKATFGHTSGSLGPGRFCNDKEPFPLVLVMIKELLLLLKELLLLLLLLLRDSELGVPLKILD
jgi:hypothetical protein